MAVLGTVEVAQTHARKFSFSIDSTLSPLRGFYSFLKRMLGSMYITAPLH